MVDNMFGNMVGDILEKLSRDDDLFSQNSLGQAPWHHILRVSHGWQDKLRGFNLYHDAMNNSDGKEFRQAD